MYIVQSTCYCSDTYNSTLKAFNNFDHVVILLEYDMTHHFNNNQRMNIVRFECWATSHERTNKYESNI